MVRINGRAVITHGHELMALPIKDDNRYSVVPDM